jgi:hypothetical protein
MAASAGPLTGAAFADESLEILAKRLGLRETFLTELQNEPDDWSFVVKAHAFLESVICTLLSLHLRKPALEEVLALKVEMHARIEMTKALNITNGRDRKVMRDLGTLRNGLVHNARETGFKFAEHFKNKDARKNFATFGQELADPVGEPPVQRAAFIEANPKTAIFHDVVRIAFYVDTEQKAVDAEETLQRALSSLQKAMSAVPPTAPPAR